MPGSPYIYDPVSKQFVHRPKQDGATSNPPPDTGMRVTPAPAAEEPLPAAKPKPESLLSSMFSVLLAGPARSVDKTTAAERRPPMPPSTVKVIMWSACGVLFGVWLVLVIIWMWQASKDADERLDPRQSADTNVKRIIIPEQGRPPEKPFYEHELQ